MEKHFMIIYENAGGVGGERIVFGYTYNDLMEHILNHYHQHFDSLYSEQIQEEEPEVIGYIDTVSEIKYCTKKDLLNFDLLIAGITLKCQEIFVGKNGFQELVNQIKMNYFGWEDLTNEDIDNKDVRLINELETSYDNDEALEKLFETINDKIW
jgi:hypothetical protein